MTENLTKYLPMALRMGGNEKSKFDQVPQQLITQGPEKNSPKNNSLNHLKLTGVE